MYQFIYIGPCDDKCLCLCSLILVRNDDEEAISDARRFVVRGEYERVIVLAVDGAMRTFVADIRMDVTIERE